MEIEREKVREFRQALLRFAQKTPSIPDVEIEVPEYLLGFGKPVFDAEKCWGCAACKIQCLDGALEVREDGERRLIVLYPWRCIACEECAKLCPKEAITIVHSINLREFLSDEPVVCVEHDVVRCENCGKPIGAAKQVDEVFSQLEGAGYPPSHWRRSKALCEECRRLLSARMLIESWGIELA